DFSSRLKGHCPSVVFHAEAMVASIASHGVGHLFSRKQIRPPHRICGWEIRARVRQEGRIGFTPGMGSVCAHVSAHRKQHRLAGSNHAEELAVSDSSHPWNLLTRPFYRPSTRYVR